MIKTLVFCMAILAYGCAGPPPPLVSGLYDFTLSAGSGWAGKMKLHDEGHGSFYGEFYIETVNGISPVLEVGRLTGTVQPDGHVDSRWAAVGFMPWNVYGQFVYDGLSKKIDGTATGSGAHDAKFYAWDLIPVAVGRVMTWHPPDPPPGTPEGTGNDGTSWPSAWPDLFTK